MMDIEPSKNPEKVPIAQVLETAKKLHEKGDFQGVMQCLSVAERTYRKQQDAESETQVLIATAQYLFDGKMWEQLNNRIEELTKVRGPIIESLKSLFKHCSKLAKQLPDGEIAVALIQTLRRVTDGNIAYEALRIELTRMLTYMYERLGKLKEAADVLMEVQVETAGTLSRDERAKILIEQVRLNLAVDNFIQAGIQAKKFSLKQTEKHYVAYYTQMIMIHLHEDDYISVARDYRAIYKACEKEKLKKDQKSLQTGGWEGWEDKEEDEADAEKENEKEESGKMEIDEVKTKGEKRREEVIATLDMALAGFASFVVMAPLSEEQRDLNMDCVKETKASNKFKTLSMVAESFLKDERIDLPIVKQHVVPSLLSESPIFEGNIPIAGENQCSFLNNKEELKKTFLEKLYQRITEHDLRVIAKFYKQMHFSRLAELLSLSKEETEKVVSRMVVSKEIYGKINRPEGTINFVQPFSSVGVLDNWTSSVTLLLSKMERVSQLIEKERITSTIPTDEEEEEPSSSSR